MKVVLVGTELVAMLNVPLVAPAGTVMVAGTDACAPEEAKATESPPAGAALEIVTVPTEAVPATTVVGLKEMDTSVGAVIAREADADCPLAEAPIVLVAFALTGTVVTVNVAVVLPARTVTVAGTVALPVAVNGTERPPTGAALLIVTVAVELTPPTTVVGLSVNPVTVGAFTVRVAV